MPYNFHERSPHLQQNLFAAHAETIGLTSESTPVAEHTKINITHLNRQQ